MNRTVAIYSALLVIALVGSYFSWTHEENPRLKDGVLVVDIAENDLGEIRYSTKDFSVSITRKNDDLGEYVWVETSRETPTIVPPADPHKLPDAADIKVGETKTVKKAFKGGMTVDPVFAMLTPFIALRAMETTPERLKEFGLDEPRGKLEVVSKGKTRVFDVGEEGYGHRNTYVRDVESKKVFLVDGGLLRPLMRADERLPERRLLEPDMAKIEKVTISSGEKSATFVQKNASDQGAAFWASEGTEAANLSAKTWLDKFLRVRSIGSPDSIGDAVQVLELKASSEGKITQIKFFKTPSTDGGEKWFVQSNFTRGAVEVPLALAANLVDDFPTLLAASSAE
jgi:hypothetical protein